MGNSFVQATEEPQAIMGGGMKATFMGAPEKYVSRARYAAGGGNFSCGVNGFKVWAKYEHARAMHSATAKNGWEVL